MAFLSGAVPLGLGLIYMNWPETWPWKAQIQPCLPYAVAGLGLGVPLIAALWTWLIYFTGKAGYDPGIGVSTAIGVGAPPFIALAILLQRTGWSPLVGLTPGPNFKEAVILAVVAPFVLLVLYGLTTLISPKVKLGRAT
jgi:hypothetical protein